MSTEQQAISHEVIQSFVNSPVRVRARWLSTSIIGLLEKCLCDYAAVVLTENGIFVITMKDIVEILPANGGKR